MKREIKSLLAELKRRGISLLNDARYWDLCRTYGDYSPEVRGHLLACVEYQRKAT